MSDGDSIFNADADTVETLWAPQTAAVFCFACRTEMTPVRVHGHEQCPFCQTVIRGCCEGECP